MTRGAQAAAASGAGGGLRRDRPGLVCGVSYGEVLCRLIAATADPALAAAREPAALYHERREIETALDALKTRLRGRDRPR